MALLKGVNPGSIMGVALAIFFVAAVIPAAISSFFNASTEGWSASTVALWALIPLAIIGLLILHFIPGGRE